MEDFNPYAAPTATTMHPRAAEWLRSTDDPSLQKVARGLGNIYTGWILIIVAAVLILVGFAPALFAALQGGAARRAGEGLLVLVVIGGIAILVGAIMIIIGYVRCLATPDETGAKGMISTAVVLAVLAFLVRLVTNAASRETVEILQFVSGLLSLGSQIAFLLFLKRLSEFIGALDLANRAKVLLILLGVTFGLGLGVGLAAAVGTALTIGLGLVLLTIWIYSVIMNLILLYRLRQALLEGSSVVGGRSAYS